VHFWLLLFVTKTYIISSIDVMKYVLIKWSNPPNNDFTNPK